VIVGAGMRTISGDVIGLFLERPIASGLTVAETAAAIMEQRGIVGLPHPFDGRRPSTAVGLTTEALMELSATIDFVEVHNGRVRDGLRNSYASDFAQRARLPGVASSDAHTSGEIGSAATKVDGDPRTASELVGTPPQRRATEGRLPAVPAGASIRPLVDPGGAVPGILTPDGQDTHSF